jgi:DNA anti-recombination protein RmuC
MSIQPFICCPCCGAEIEISARAPVQTELPLFFALSNKKKLDVPEHNSFKMHAHDHVHALNERSEELTAAEQDLLEQIEELTASENRAAHFRTTWIKRIREHPNQVFAAIGEARSIKREGAVRKSIGGVLNWHFERFREAAMRRKSA